MSDARAEAHSEARRILSLCRDDHLKAFEMIQSQFAVLVLRAQVMLSLSGIVITVTGFSGKAIAQTSALARYSIVAGLFIVLTAAAVAVGGVLRLKWLTQTLSDDSLGSLVKGIEMRDKKARYLGIALSLFVLGFSLYCVAVAQLLIAS